MMNPNASIKVQVQKEKVIVYLTIQNPSPDSALSVEKSKVISSPDLRAKLFRVFSGDQEIPYVGPMVKLAAPGPNDFFDIKPDGELHGGADISHLYQFLSGSHEYTIQYKAFHLDKHDPEKLKKVESNVATFAYTR
jgi:hypothetical protein